jgi:hypothetical protein
MTSEELGDEVHVPGVLNLNSEFITFFQYTQYEMIGFRIPNPEKMISTQRGSVWVGLAATAYG